MPANLPPQYFEAEKRFRLAKTPKEKIDILHEMLAIMPKHKGTDKLQADLRAKISKLNKLSQKTHVKGRRDSLYYVNKEGAGQVVILGEPNAGKSQILTVLTHANPEVASYPFTTRKPIVGMMNFEDIAIQLIDTSPITSDFCDYWLLDMSRTADLLLFLVDLGGDVVDQIETIIKKLNEAKVFFEKRVLIAGNKNDLNGSEEKVHILTDTCAKKFPVISVSAKEKKGLLELKRKIYDGLNIIRVYTKVPSKPPDKNVPFVLKRESTVLDAARTVHKDFGTNLRYARLWGAGKYDGQRVERDHILQDGDVVEFHIS